MVAVRGSAASIKEKQPLDESIGCLRGDGGLIVAIRLVGPWGACGWRSNRQRIGFALLRILAGL